MTDSESDIDVFSDKIAGLFCPHHDLILTTFSLREGHFLLSCQSGDREREVIRSNPETGGRG